MMFLSRKSATAALIALTVLAASHNAKAGNLLTNGDFSQNGGTGQLTVNTSVSGWTGGGTEGAYGSQTTPPVFDYTGGATSATGDNFMGTVSFYDNPTSAISGTTIAADGDPAWNGSLSQTVTGLTVGDSYTLSFNWAGAQQTGYTGPTTEQWKVNFGTDTQYTSVVSTPSQGFEGWQTASMTFTASSTSQLLQFVAVGSPAGLPPWLLLNGASLTVNAAGGGGGGGGLAVPEPTSVFMLSIGTLGLAGVGLLRRARAAKS